MPTAIIFHEVENREVWENAWKAGPESRHAMFGEVGIKARCFCDSDDPNATGLILEIPDLEAFREMLDTEVWQRVMKEDGLKLETMRFLVEFAPQ